MFNSRQWTSAAASLTSICSIPVWLLQLMEGIARVDVQDDVLHIIIAGIKNTSLALSIPELFLVHSEAKKSDCNINQLHLLRGTPQRRPPPPFQRSNK